MHIDAEDESLLDMTYIFPDALTIQELLELRVVSSGFMPIHIRSLIKRD